MKQIKNVTGITLLFVLIATVFTTMFLPSVARDGIERNNQIQYTYAQTRDEDLTDAAFQKAFELYYRVKKQADDTITLSSLYLKDGASLSEEDTLSFSSTILNNISNYTNNNLELLYYVTDTKTGEVLTNAGAPLSSANISTNDLSSEYEWFIEIVFDKSGIPTINSEHSSNPKAGSTQDYYDAFNHIFQGDFHLENTPTDTNFVFNDKSYQYQAIENTTFRFAIRDSSMYYGSIDTYTYYPDGTLFQYILMAASILIISVGLLIISNKEAVITGFHFENNVDTHIYHKTSLRDVPFEAVLIADIAAFDISCNLGSISYSIVPGFIILFLLYLFIAYNVWYYALLFRYKDYRKHSISIWIWNHIKEPCHKFYDYALHLDMSNRDTKRLIILVFVNFMILFFIYIMFYAAPDAYMMMILIYTIVLYILLKKYIGSINKDYHRLLDVIRNIAVGKTNDHIDEDLGIFNPFKPDLKDIQTNIETAIAEEVHSQQMKTELITNVSHDLKTPLTSLISYIDLLRKEDISDEDRKKYLDILDKSSLRLKHLVEDLFEVSKANSGNISLDLMKVDIVSLMKQVQVECEDTLKKRKLSIRNTFSDDKVILLLDSQKTYRIFENLISNICKYALRGTRVYIDIKDYETFVEVSLKNISAQELNFDVDDITERFMRGDKSRNTEGSGLGLAIVKSFTELQNGTLKIQTDGDLFKVFIRFPKKAEEDKHNVEKEGPLS